jgi:hypothetical protein
VWEDNPRSAATRGPRHCPRSGSLRCRDEGCDFAIAAKRNTAMWRACAGIGEQEWADAQDMPGAQVAACDYAPAGWPDDTYTIVRRVRVDADSPPTHARGGGAPSTPTSSRLPWRGPPPTPTRSASSSPTSPSTFTATNARPPRTSRPGSGAAPTSRTGSVKPSSVPRCGASHLDTHRNPSTRSVIRGHKPAHQAAHAAQTHPSPRTCAKSRPTWGSGSERLVPLSVGRRFRRTSGYS